MTTTQITTHVDDALARFRERFRGKVNLTALVTVLVTQVQERETAQWQLFTERSIENGVGAQLDAIGVVVNQPRNGLSDTEYKRYLYGRIAASNSSGIIDNVIHVLDLVLGDSDAHFFWENQPPASFELEVQDVAVTDALAEALADFMFDAKTAGVRGLLKTGADEPEEMFTLARFAQMDRAHPAGATELNVNTALAAFEASGSLILQEGIHAVWRWFPLPNEAYLFGIPAAGNVTGLLAATVLTAAGVLQYQQAFTLPGGNSMTFTEGAVDAVAAAAGSVYNSDGTALAILYIGSSDTGVAANRQIFGKMSGGGVGYELVQNAADNLEFNMVGDAGPGDTLITAGTIDNVGTPFYAMAGVSITQAKTFLKTSVGDDEGVVADIGSLANPAVVFSVGAGNELAHGGDAAIMLVFEGANAEAAWLIGAARLREYFAWLQLAEAWRYDEIEELIAYTGWVANLRHVVWTDLTNCVDNGNGDLEKTGGGAAWNSSATSEHAIIGNGYVEWISTGSSDDVIVGLTNGVGDYSQIDFAIIVHTGFARVWENGVQKALFAVSASDVLRVQVNGAGVVTYWQNGSLIYTSVTTPTMPLMVDSSIFDVGDEIINVRLFGAREPVTWASLVNCTDNGQGTIEKTGGGAAWDAGGISTKTLDGDGYVECLIPQTPGYIGLSNGDTDQSATDIDFAIAVNGTAVEAREGGALVATSSTAYAATDLFRVMSDGGVISYWQNGVKFYTSLVTPTYPLLVDCSLYNVGDFVLGVQLVPHLEESGGGSFTGVGPSVFAHPADCAIVKSDGPGKGCARPPVVWVDGTNVTADGNDLEKTGGGAAWNGGAISLHQVASGNCYVEFTTAEAGYSKACGLNNGVSSVDEATIDFAFFLRGTLGLRIKENGITKWNATDYTAAADDLFRVQVISGVVTYYYNGTLVYTSLTAPTYPLAADAAFLSVGGTIVNAVLIEDNSGKLASVKEGS